MKIRITIFLSIIFLAILGFVQDASAANVNFTLSAWIKGGGTIFSRAILAKDDEYRMAVDSSSHLLCQFHNGSSWQTAAVSTSTIITNTWYFVACTYDGEHIKAYVNAEEKGSTDNAENVNNTSYHLKIGADDDDSTSYRDFYGYIDEVKVYSYAQTTVQLEQDYAAGQSGLSLPRGTKAGFGGDSSGWQYGWSYRKKITIDPGKVTEDLTDFPMLVNLTDDAGLDTNAQDDGDDIIFTDIDGNRLSHEIEKYDATGDLVAWVKLPHLLRAVNNYIYMYYGNSSANNQENVADVWSNGFAGVWHLNQTHDTNYSSFEMLDSLNYNNLTYTSNGGTFYSDVSGKIDEAVDFNSVATDMKLWKNDSDSHLAITQNITLEAWVNYREVADATAWDSVVAKERSSVTHDYSLSCNTSVSPPRMRLVIVDAATGNTLFSSQGLSGANTALSEGNWQYFAGTYNGSFGAIYLYNSSGGGNAENPKYTGTQAATIRNSTSADIFIGQFGSNHNWHGLIDEVRVSNVVRSQQWIQTQYNNQNDLSTFYSLGSEEVSSGTNRVFRDPKFLWNFEEGYGATAHSERRDAAALDGTLNAGATGGNDTTTEMWDMNGFNGKGIELDGTDDYISIPDFSY